MTTERTHALARIIADGIAKQDEEFDNLGDAESIVFTGIMPTVNLVELAEYIEGNFGAEQQ